jgi:hypothetical protein
MVWQSLCLLQPCMNPVSGKFDVCCNKVEDAALNAGGAAGPLPATQGLATSARQVGLWWSLATVGLEDFILHRTWATVFGRHGFVFCTI